RLCTPRGGKASRVKVRKVIRRRLGEAGVIDAVVAANVNEPGASTVRASSKQRIVVSGRRTKHDPDVNHVERPTGR
ncbi:MAG: hypothetical protein M3394_08960, partial [Actinomycetota bacterium]|nr:hypothetical protein [Actinomycetota bacterium]